MQTRIHPRFASTPGIELAEEALRSCVHCGFCNATCPTYQELGDERDGPRGRIYLLKQLLEEGQATERSRRHLDRCLTCLACETTCPSGVRYGRLAETGRELLEHTTKRPLSERFLRRALRWLVPRPARFSALLRLGRGFAPLLPATLRSKLPRRQNPGPTPPARHERTVVLLRGCAQAVATPRSNAAARRVLDRLGISGVEPRGAGCCGAVSLHLAAPEEAKRFVRRNLDAWAPWLERAEAVVSLSSGCGAMLRDYGHLMRDDPRYRDLARRVSALAQDLSEILDGEDLSAPAIAARGPTALHCPCTLTHSLRAHGTLRRVLTRAGIELVATREDHLCCGSAGTYSILQSDLSRRLLERKLAALTGESPDRIVTANVGCQLHLGSRSSRPVQHWIELLDADVA